MNYYRHFTLVDTLGLLFMVKVVAANVPEREGAKQLLAQMKQEQHRVPRLTRIWFDGGFSGPDCLVQRTLRKPQRVGLCPAEGVCIRFFHWVMNTCRWIVDVVLRPEGSKGFVLIPKRWTVERTYDWLHWCRRLNLDYERLPTSSVRAASRSEAFIHIAMIRLMLRRLA